MLTFLLVPGVVAGLLPALLASFDPWRFDGYSIAYVTLALGLCILLRCVWDFYTTGKGTLAQWHPPRRLVTIGFYRHTRNPMYIGVLTIVASLTLVSGSPLLAGYFVVLATLFQWHVIYREEPWLAREFPDAWVRYRASVPRWLYRARGD